MMTCWNSVILESIFRKTQFLSGSNIYIAEDFSKKVRDKRTELRKFMKQTKKRSPGSKMSLRYDKLIINKDVYTYNEQIGSVELQIPAGGNLARYRINLAMPVLGMGVSVSLPSGAESSV